MSVENDNTQRLRNKLLYGRLETDAEMRQNFLIMIAVFAVIGIFLSIVIAGGLLLADFLIG